LYSPKFQRKAKKPHAKPPRRKEEQEEQEKQEELCFFKKRKVFFANFAALREILFFFWFKMNARNSTIRTRPMTSSPDRTLTLRERCLERKNRIGAWDSDPRLVARSLQSSPDTLPWTLRRGTLTRDLLSWTTFALDDLELLVGRLAPDQPGWQEERESGRAWLAEHAPTVFTPGQSGHCQLDLSRLLELGIDGLGEDIDRLAASNGEKREVYESFRLALEGLQQMVLHAAEAAEQAHPTAEQARSGENAARAAELGEAA
jgi:hypothetical protein